MWKASGGELFNQFVDVSRWDKYGSWGFGVPKSGT